MSQSTTFDLHGFHVSHPHCPFAMNFLFFQLWKGNMTAIARKFLKEQQE